MMAFTHRSSKSCPMSFLWIFFLSTCVLGFRPGSMMHSGDSGGGLPNVAQNTPMPFTSSGKDSFHNVGTKKTNSSINENHATDCPRTYQSCYKRLSSGALTCRVASETMRCVLKEAIRCNDKGVVYSAKQQCMKTCTDNPENCVYPPATGERKTAIPKELEVIMEEERERERKGQPQREKERKENVVRKEEQKEGQREVMTETERNMTRNRNEKKMMGDENPESKVMEEENQNSKPTDDENQNSKPTDDENQNSKPTEDENKKSKPTEDKNQNSKLMEDENQISKPMENGNHKSKPTEDENQNRKLMEDENQNRKPTDDENQNSKPTEDENKKSKPTEDKNQNSKLREDENQNKLMKNGNHKSKLMEDENQISKPMESGNHKSKLMKDENQISKPMENGNHKSKLDLGVTRKDGKPHETGMEALGLTEDFGTSLKPFTAWAEKDPAEISRVDFVNEDMEDFHLGRNSTGNGTDSRVDINWDILGNNRGVVIDFPPVLIYSLAATLFSCFT